MCLKNLNMHSIPQKEITKQKLKSLQISLYKSLRLVSIPTNEILLMEEILHQLRLVVYPFIPLFTGFCTFQVVLWDFFHQAKPTLHCSGSNHQVLHTQGQHQKGGSQTL